MHPLLAQAMNPLRSAIDRKISWDAWERLREQHIKSVIGASWYEFVHSGSGRVADVPLEYRDFVYAQIAHHHASTLRTA